ncbi:DUF6670 family protein [Acinetobacter pragensis]|uniref:Uncharacterized protein n=1 Tax=Acinetobacter pragensis TaxID=1806892 RepID=A0A151Y5H6_9GAMM|nr:DUF6670 family protein [Acinetobacter pragensis]KYQ73312.1 hypothetical protein AZH43_06220 [Acinetobacter pragensis]
MQLFKGFLDQSKQLNQTPAKLVRHLPLHAQTSQYKTILLGLKIPNLPAPLHYLNFISVIGRPNASIFCQEKTQAGIDQNNKATVMSSSSLHMVGQFSSYEIDRECNFQAGSFHFLDRESFSGNFPDFQLQRVDGELSFDLKIKTAGAMCYFNKLRMGLAEYWSQLSECSGELNYKGRHYAIQQLGSLEFARIMKFPFLPIAFYSSQIINLSGQRQLIVMQTRDKLNRVLQSRAYLKDLKKNQAWMCDENVTFHIHRLYPAVKTPNFKKMYLPREFEWNIQAEGIRIHIQAKSRGDFKFGLGAGFAGSFSYLVKINDQLEEGEGGYCEYIDCRPLNWQEKNKAEKLLDELGDSSPIFLKK